MYTYRDEGGAVAAHGVGFLSGVGAGRSGQLPQELEKVFTSTLLHSRAHHHTAAIEMKTTNVVCSTMKSPLHTTPQLNFYQSSLTVSPAAQVCAKKLAQCTIYFS